VTDAETEQLFQLGDEDLISRLGPGPGGNVSDKVRLILELRRSREQAQAARAQGAAGIALVAATADLVSATRRLAWATWALVGVTAFLVLVAASQAYLMFTGAE
jgi:hypothetical protein